MGTSRRVVRLDRIRTNNKAAASLIAQAVHAGGGTAITSGPQHILARLPDHLPIEITIRQYDPIAELRARYRERGELLPSWLRDDS